MTIICASLPWINSFIMALQCKRFRDIPNYYVIARQPFKTNSLIDDNEFKFHSFNFVSDGCMHAVFCLFFCVGGNVDVASATLNKYQQNYFESLMSFSYSCSDAFCMYTISGNGKQQPAAATSATQMKKKPNNNYKLRFYLSLSSSHPDAIQIEI